MQKCQATGDAADHDADSDLIYGLHVQVIVQRAARMVLGDEEQLRRNAAIYKGQLSVYG